MKIGLWQVEYDIQCPSRNTRFKPKATALSRFCTAWIPPAALTCRHCCRYELTAQHEMHQTQWEAHCRKQQRQERRTKLIRDVLIVV